MMQLPNAKEFLETSTERAIETIKFGAQVANGGEGMDLDALAESDWWMVELGITAGIVSAVEELQRRGLLS